MLEMYLIISALTPTLLQIWHLPDFNLKSKIIKSLTKVCKDEKLDGYYLWKLTPSKDLSKTEVFFTYPSKKTWTFLLFLNNEDKENKINPELWVRDSKEFIGWSYNNKNSPAVLLQDNVNNHISDIIDFNSNATDYTNTVIKNNRCWYNY